MSDFIINNEASIRLSFFFGMLAIMALWEFIAPRRTPKISKSMRWFNNLGLVFFNSLVLRLLIPFAATGVAIFANDKQLGLLNSVEIPLWLNVIIAVIVLDLVIYWQHRLFHAIPIFWRLHKVHHADQDYDVTTGSRFHTLEIILSMLIKFLLILALGPAVLAVIIFEVLLNANAMFNHGNVGLPAWLDKYLRWFIVTPDMHRIHHSVIVKETNSNYGFNLTWWDRIFNSYTDKAEKGQLGMTIGLKEYKEVKQTNWITGMLMMPFRK